ncbi:hypothetical protein LCGC14_2795160 [marine sediment metagenome]|uniref:Uncharacterized protein n=1 Tax=marine sediment metagenome TaxID=412755 RepID=A0A0F9BFR2_9ZZZZ
MVEYIQAQLTAGGWNDVTTEKTFSEVYTLTLPVICVRAQDTDHYKIEIGSESTVRSAMVLIDIFALNDGQRLDLKDFLVSVLKGGCPYYEFITVRSGRNSSVGTRTLNGRIRVTDIDDTPIDFEVQKSDLDKHDRHRHRLTLEISTGQVET